MDISVTLKRVRDGDDYLEYENSDHRLPTSVLPINQQLKEKYEFDLACTAELGCTPKQIASISTTEGKKKGKKKKSTSTSTIIVEPLGFTMFDHLRCSSRRHSTTDNWDGVGWWRKTDQGFRFDSWLQQILKKMIEGIAELNTKRMVFEFDMTTIYLSNNEYNPEPRFSMLQPQNPRPKQADQQPEDQPQPQRNMFAVLQLDQSSESKQGKEKSKFDMSHLWTELGSTVDELIKYCGTRIKDFNEHPEVTDFMRMLKDQMKFNSRCMVGHPALLCDKEILDFIVRFREDTRSNKVDTISKANKECSNLPRISKDWEAYVSNDLRMKKCLDFWNKDIALAKKKKIETHPVRFARFIGNFFNHTNSSNYVKEFNTVYDYHQMEVIFETYTMLPSYIFRISAVGEQIAKLKKEEEKKGKDGGVK